MRKVWLTRTQPGADRQAQQLRDAGYDAVVWPLIDIVELEPPALQLNGEPVACADSAAVQRPPPQLVIAVSGHAVTAAHHRQLLPGIEEAEFIAVGAQTGKLLSHHLGNEQVVLTPAVATSEGVLAMPEIAQLASGARVWILAGQGGRTLLAQQLHRDYGATVVKFELYERVERTQTAPLDAQVIDVVVIASEQGLSAFDRQWRRLQGDALVTLVVPSSRVADAAAEMGFSNIHTAAGADTDALMTALQGIITT